MKTSRKNIGQIITTYGCKTSEKPKFALLGKCYFKKRRPDNTMKTVVQSGIITTANNEFHAHLLKRELNKYGSVDIKFTEHHSSPDFSLEKFIKIYNKELEKKKCQKAKKS